jgi:hypothetical protein
VGVPTARSNQRERRLSSNRVGQYVGVREQDRSALSGGGHCS